MKNGRARYDIGWDNPKTTNLVWSCRENGPNTTTKNYDSLQTWRKKKTRPSPKNLERWNINSHEWKRSKNGRMEQPKAMELAVGRRRQTFLNRAIYIYISYIIWIEKLSIKSRFILLKKAQVVVQKTSRKNPASTVLIFSSFLSFWWTSWVEKSHST